MEISERAVFSLSIAAAHLVAAVLLTAVLARMKRVSTVDWLVLLWLSYDLIVHVTLEGPFVYFSLTGKVIEAEGVLANVWQEYALADFRWGVSDPVIVSLEILTVVFCSILCVLIMYAIITDKPHRHFWQVVLCTCELYGGWMTFCPEWLTGSVNLNTGNPLHLWCYLTFFNGIWVVIPLLLLAQSWSAITSCAVPAHSSDKKQR